MVTTSIKSFKTDRVQCQYVGNPLSNCIKASICINNIRYLQRYNLQTAIFCNDTDDINRMFFFNEIVYGNLLNIKAPAVTILTCALVTLGILKVNFQHKDSYQKHVWSAWTICYFIVKHKL